MKFITKEEQTKSFTPTKVSPVDRISGPTPFKSTVQAAAGVAGGLGALELGGRATQGVGKALYGVTYPPSMAEAARTQSYRAGVSNLKPRTLVETAVEQPLVQKGGRTPSSYIGQMGTRSQIGTQSKAKASNIFKNTINPIFEKSNKQGVKFDFNNLYDDVLKQIQANPTYSIQAKKDIIQSVTDLFDDLKGTTDLKNLDMLKREIVKKLPQKYVDGRGGLPPQSLQQARTAVSNAFRKKVHETIKSKFGVNSAKLYTDYANLEGLAKVGQKAMTEGGRKGGSGTMFSWISDELLTPFTTTSGKLTYKAGSAMRVLPKKVAQVLKGMAKKPTLKKMVNGMIRELPASLIAEEFGKVVSDSPGINYDATKRTLENMVSDIENGKDVTKKSYLLNNLSNVPNWYLVMPTIKGKSKEEQIKLLRKAQNEMGGRPEKIKSVFESVLGLLK